MPSQVSFINAKLKGVRLIREASHVDEDLIRPGLNLQMHDRTSIEARWENTPEGKEELVIVYNIDTAFSDEQGNEIVAYDACHHYAFTVKAYTGFTPAQDLPNDAIEPYLAISSWLSRTRAAGSIRSMGLTTFSWPAEAPSSSPDETPQAANEQQTKQTPKKRSKSTKKQST